MNQEEMQHYAADRQKAKILTFFCVLGFGGFITNLLAGYFLWMHNRSSGVEVPTYDRFVMELQRTLPDKVGGMATQMYENWSACATSQSGWTQVTTHALITSSVVGAVVFAICASLAFQMYRRLTARQAEWAPPQPPDVIDGYK